MSQSPQESYREYMIRITRKAALAREAALTRSAEAPAPVMLVAAYCLLCETLGTLSTLTSEDFARGADRELRRKIATFLGLNLEDYSL